MSPFIPKAARRAFTLIELLVVIAIISLLAAILFPVFGRVRENARRATCQSNMKQIGMAFAQYAQDYDEYLPLNNGGTAATTQTVWDSAIGPYLGYKVTPTANFNKPPMLLRCPSDPIVLAQANINAGQFLQSYGMPNPTVATFAAGVMKDKVVVGTEWFWPSRKLSEISSPAATLGLVEYPSITNYVGTLRLVGSPVVQQTEWGPSHFDGWNYLFCDGHVKWLNPEQTVGVTGTLASPRGYWTIADND